MKVRAAVYAQLFVPGCGAHIAFGVAAQMQRESAPVADAVHRHRDFVPARTAHAPELGIEIMAHVLPQQIVVECMGVVAARSAEQVMSGLLVMPVGDKPIRKIAAVLSLF